MDTTTRDRHAQLDTPATDQALPPARLACDCPADTEDVVAVWSDYYERTLRVCRAHAATGAGWTWDR